MAALQPSVMQTIKALTTAAGHLLGSKTYIRRANAMYLHQLICYINDSAHIYPRMQQGSRSQHTCSSLHWPQPAVWQQNTELCSHAYAITPLPVMTARPDVESLATWPLSAAARTNSWGWAAHHRCFCSSSHGDDNIQAQATPQIKQPARSSTHAAEAQKGFVRGGYTVDMFPPSRIRNFCIIAHVDHGKSTLADRLMEMTGALAAGKAYPAQFLDKLQVERERGITVKAQTVSLVYQHEGVDYLLNLIDTPGHVDFSYEVSRSLAACQGALLLVDAGQGVQAQTVANWRLAVEQGLTIVAALNKIDLPQADPTAVAGQLEAVCEVPRDQVLRLSAKSGRGVRELLPQLVQCIPPPSGQPQAPLRLLLFDAFHDEFRGVIALTEVVDGSVSRGDRLQSSASGDCWEVLELGVLAPERHPTQQLLTGQVGYIITGTKDLKAVRVGDTWVRQGSPAPALPGFRPARSMVYAGVYPISAADFDQLATAMERLTLNDASVVVSRENSDALGPGFRCGFLGMLHMEVFMQRLQQEHHASVVTTTPTVPYLVDLGPDEEPLQISRASDLPDDMRVQCILEPTVKATIITPMQYTGKVLQLCSERRGELLEHISLEAGGHASAGSRQQEQPDGSSSVGSRQAAAGADQGIAASSGAGAGEAGRCLMRFVLPLSELAGDLYSQLKACTQGYATFDYEEGDYRPAELQRLDILAHGKPVDALARLVHKNEIVTVGRALISKMKQLLPRQQFEVVLQASVSGRIVARETLKALRKDVTAKCYGGDITRKRKLLDKQKAGKKAAQAQAKRLGSIDVPTSAFPELMRIR